MSNLPTIEQARAAPPNIDLGYRRIGVLTRLPDVVAGFGVDPDEVLNAAGLARDHIARQEGSISYVAMGRLLGAAAAATGCAHIGLLLGREANLQTLGLVGQLLAHSPSVIDGMRALVQNYERFGRGSHVYLISQGSHWLWGYAVHQKDMPHVEHAYDFALSAGHRFLHLLSGQGPSEVLLPRARPVDVGAYRETFKAPVRFDSEHAALVIPAAVANAPIKGADPARMAEIAVKVEAYWATDGVTFADRVLQMIRRTILAERQPTAPAVAQALGLHPKTLSRRLQDEGATFRALLAHMRLEMAKQLLDCTRMSVTEIALAVQYTDIAAFNHAFLRWTGVSPGEWRKGSGDRDLPPNCPIRSSGP